jgi:hypothetical protein
MSGSFNSQYSSYPAAASPSSGFSPPALPGTAATIAAKGAGKK